jgi:hypothetical protein
MNNILDLFGTTVNKSARIVSLADMENIALCQNTLNDPEVRQYLAESRHQVKTLNGKLKGISGVSEVGILSISD